MALEAFAFSGRFRAGPLGAAALRSATSGFAAFGFAAGADFVAVLGLAAVSDTATASGSAAGGGALPVRAVLFVCGLAGVVRPSAGLGDPAPSVFIAPVPASRLEGR
ncbi:MAG: hypothetical protein AB7O39_13460 [Flavobacteriaceae bacterium]